MLDIKFIRENPEVVRKTIKDRQKDPSLVDRVLKLDEKRRGIIKELEELKRKRKYISQIGQESVEEGRKIREKIQSLEPKLEETESQFYQNLILTPNLLLADVPLGK